MTTPSTKEIQSARDEAAYRVYEEGRSRYPAMSYEEGVEAALAWVIGDTDENPMED